MTNEKLAIRKEMIEDITENIHLHFMGQENKAEMDGNAIVANLKQVAVMLDPDKDHNVGPMKLG